MKELSIEQKAAAYDIAIKELRNAFYNDNNRMCEEYRQAVIKVIEPIFPELKESEDEMIRKRLVRFVTNYMGDIGKKECLDWLEKAVTPTPQDWNDYKDKPVELWNMYVKGLANGVERGKNAVKNHPQDYGFEKQGEQKPVTDFSDLRTWKYIVDAVCTEKEGIGQYLDSPFTEKVAKKLQERFGNIEQISTEWSEEDKRLFNSTIWHLRHSVNNGDTEHSAGQLEDWLKLLKQRCTWKPSEEQLRELEHVFSSDTNSWDKDILRKLYEQLKQL